MVDSNSSLEFDLLYSQTTELFKAFPEFQFKTVTALLVIIGWLLTSGGAQTFIHDNSAIALPSSAIAFGLLIAFKFVWIIGHYRRMREMHRRLVALAPMKGVSVESVAVFDLRWVLPATYLAVNVLLSSAALTVVCDISLPADQHENRGTRRLARGRASLRPKAHQGSRSRNRRGMEMEQSGLVPRRNRVHR